MWSQSVFLCLSMLRYQASCYFAGYDSLAHFAPNRSQDKAAGCSTLLQDEVLKQETSHFPPVPKKKQQKSTLHPATQADRRAVLQVARIIRPTPQKVVDK